VNKNLSVAAVELAGRRSEGRTGPLLPETLRPGNFEQAFALQQAVGKLFAGETAEAVAGWKCALPVAEKTVIGAIYRSTVQSQRDATAASVCFLHPDRDGLARVEPELAFELSKNLPPRETPYTQAEIDAAVGKTRLALELIQSRYDDPAQASFFDALADGLVNQGLWLGPEVIDTVAADLSCFDLHLTSEKGLADVIAGRHPNTNPRAGLYWLVNFLSEQGIGLRQGQQIITGSYAGLLKLPMAEQITIRCGDFGRYVIEFEAS
jgi:2-keto-4-pentenoate hydratase